MTLRYALTMRVTQADGYVEPRDSISHDWISCFDSHGIEPLLVPNRLSDSKAYLDALAPDLLVLTGGDDLGVTQERDETESLLLGHALSIGLPVFGSCRGMQLINRHFGGQETAIEGHIAMPHKVTVSPPFDSLYGNKISVNSFHALGIEPSGMGKKLRCFATDDEGWIEGVYHPDKPVAAVMWHPEREMPGNADLRLMERLVKEN